VSKKIINVVGANEHNLQNISVQIPRDELTVITGLSGSGKSSLAFDTIYAEGQRKYVESLSAYARQFLGQMQKPDVEYIDGLSPSVSIEQRTASSNPRSLVATTTEIYDYLRLMFSSIGKTHCYKCGKPVINQSAEQIVDILLSNEIDKKVMILSPVIRGKKGEHAEVINQIRKQGFVRVRLNGKIIDLDDFPKIKKTQKHTIEIVIDRLKITKEIRSRLTDAVELALNKGCGLINVLSEGYNGWNEKFFSELNACIDCGISFEKLEARHFSFNSPYGACPTCQGLGTRLVFDEKLIIPDQSIPWTKAVHPMRFGGRRIVIYYNKLLHALSYTFNVDPDIPFEKLSNDFKEILLHGSYEVNIEYYMRRKLVSKPFPGVFKLLQKRLEDNEIEGKSHRLREYMTRLNCPTCSGNRLKPEILGCTINKKNIRELISLSVEDAYRFFQNITLSPQELLITKEINKEILSRLGFLIDVGLEYLTLDRESGSLSGGEAQRIKLATQIGAGLVGVVYVLDEPSIGLHQKDNDRLIKTLKGLRDLGNTVIVVEHDEQTILLADHIVDMGPLAGKMGGKIVFSGSVNNLLKSNTLTAKYLKKELKVEVPEKRNKSDKGWLKLTGASENNLKKVNVNFPLGLFTCVTGVSGSGKSTLVDTTLKRILSRHFHNSKDAPGEYSKVEGLDLVDKMIVIDQSPIGRTPRSNPATYTGAFTEIRELFAKLPSSKAKGFKPGRYSFNVKGGRCETCKGDGVIKIEMHFLPNVYVPCEQCNSQRYNAETLSIKYKGINISDVLNLSINEALDYFSAIPKIYNKFKTLQDVGLGYLKLGQSATTLSGGEAQRIKLAAELSKRSTGKTVYILDEPTTGLHFADVHKLIEVLERLRDEGNTIIVIEHNLDMIKRADYIIDMGPEGGINGGKVIAFGTPEKVSQSKLSFTGKYLKNLL
tara:strand:+ start:2193 stop:5006 length:2814 start_codon:yes stop_codon:yes gene_type:complete